MSDLFSFFKAMNSGNFDYVDAMEDDEVKKISPFVLTMWCNGATSNPEIHNIVTNTYCNHLVFSLAEFPRLLLKLFIAANAGIDDTRYTFKKCVTRRDVSKIKMIATYYQCSYDNAKGYAKILSDADFKEIENSIGDGQV